MMQKKMTAPVLEHRDGQGGKVCHYYRLHFIKNGGKKSMKTFKRISILIIHSSRRAVKYTAGLAATLLGIAGLCALAAGNVAGVLVALIGANAALGVKEAAND